MTIFNNQKYLDIQREKILERLDQNVDKMYIEFGGKLFYDSHAERVLPGYVSTNKIDLLTELADRVEVVIAIYAGDIVNMKCISDSGESYCQNTLKTVAELRKRGIQCNNIVITRVDEFENDVLGIKLFETMCIFNKIIVHKHKFTKGYPYNIDIVVSEEGYGKNSYIETEKPIVVVTGPGANSGKLATCLSQLYKENQAGLKSGYAKFESFPIWNLGIDHPVNIAYEAATIDIGDYNTIDTYYKDAEGIDAVNYNRDMNTFPIIKEILHKIYGYDIYKSPTHMGINMLGFCIEDEQAVCKAAIDEIYRRLDMYGEEYDKRKTDIESRILSFN